MGFLETGNAVLAAFGVLNDEFTKFFVVFRKKFKKANYSRTF